MLLTLAFFSTLPEQFRTNDEMLRRLYFPSSFALSTRPESAPGTLAFALASTAAKIRQEYGGPLTMEELRKAPNTNNSAGGGGAGGAGAAATMAPLPPSAPRNGPARGGAGAGGGVAAGRGRSLVERRSSAPDLEGMLPVPPPGPRPPGEAGGAPNPRRARQKNTR